MRKLWLTGALVLLGTVAVATLAPAQTTSNGPYYATPSWDQQLPASTRFIVLLNWGSNAVLDRETGVVWERNPSIASNWVNVQHNFVGGCIASTTGGRSGWRLPTLQELQSLGDPATNDLPAGHPFGTNATGTFWSATTNAGDSTLAEVWGFGTSIAGSELKTKVFPAWCVRSPYPGFAGQ